MSSWAASTSWSINAGFGYAAEIGQVDVDRMRELFETNVFGLVEVTRRALPALRASGGGVICNVTSCSVLAPMPLFAAYRASKAAVGAFGESLRVEVAPAGIRVLEVMPGVSTIPAPFHCSRTPSLLPAAHASAHSA